MRISKKLLWLGALMILASCGQKGALYIPAEPQDNRQLQKPAISESASQEEK